jgi:glutamate-1-semialdehyde aminotransferase
MEPVINYEPEEGYLQRIRELTEENNIILIFDEMKTGFRLSIGGAQKYFDVVPDLAVFAKGLSNGFPISVLTGRKYLMEQFENEKCFLSASYATEKASINAALKTLEILERDNVIGYVWEMGGILKEGIARCIEKNNLGNIMQIVGLAPMTHIIFSDYDDITVNDIKSFIQQECARMGVLFVGYHHTCLEHKTGDIEFTLKVYDEVFSLLSKALSDRSVVDKLIGKPICAFGVR